MQPQRPVYWYSGQFLEPQHFQQADAFHASERASLLQSAQPCFWGVGNLDVDEAALAEGRILVRSGIMRFQDGTEVVIAAVPEDGNAILPSRSFREAWTDPHMPFTVFAGLPPLKPYGNVAGIPSCMRDGGRLIGCDADTLPEAPGRYLCPNSDDSIADRYALPLATESRRDMPVRSIFIPASSGKTKPPTARIGCFCRCCASRTKAPARALIPPMRRLPSMWRPTPCCAGSRADSKPGLPQPSAALSQPGGADSMSPQPPDSFCS